MRVYGRKTITAYHTCAHVQAERNTSKTGKTSLGKQQCRPEDFRNISYSILDVEIDNCGI
jgi:hypothetical protein